MFSKPTNTPSTPARPAPANLGPLNAAPSEPARRAGPKIASVIAEEMTIEGSVVGEGEFHVDGVVRGDIKVGRLTIGETGHIEGSVIADAVECRGRIVGSLTAKQVRLYGSAHVDGDITHEQLAMETGAFFQGRSLKFQRQVTPPQAAPQPVITGEVIKPAAAPL
jgi:cytoskeletal protein CcmA (bactofilin family)